MAVVGCKVLATREGGYSEKWQREYIMRYLVETSSSYDGVNVVLRSASAIAHGVPQINQQYVARGYGEADYGARCVESHARAVDGDPRLWEVECRFRSTEQQETEEDAEPQEPSERKPTVAIRFEKLQVPVFIDAAQTQGVCNSRDEPFSPPVMKEKSRMVISLTRRDTVLDLVGLIILQDVINQPAYMDFPTGTLKLNVADVHEEFTEGVRYWVKTFELAHEPDGWNPWVLDRGYKVDEDTGNFREILLDGFGDETTKDQPFLIPVGAYSYMNFSTITPIRELEAGLF